MREERLIETVRIIGRNGGLGLEYFLHLTRLACLVPEEWFDDRPSPAADSSGKDSPFADDPGISQADKRYLSNLWKHERLAPPGEGVYLFRELRRQLRGPIAELLAFGDEIDVPDSEGCPTTPPQTRPYFPAVDMDPRNSPGRPDEPAPERNFDSAYTVVFPTEEEGHLVVPTPLTDTKGSES